MIKSIKKAIVRYFAPKKPRRVVTTPATPDVKAMGAACDDVVKCLRAVLAKKLRAVTDAVDGYGLDFDDDAIKDALAACNPEWGKYWRGDTTALCAAIQRYDVAGTIDAGNFGLAIEQIDCAVAFIKENKFIFYEGVGTYEGLGYEQLVKEVNNLSLIHWLADYFDCEALGKDYANDTDGEFTRFGFFAPVIEYE